MKERLWIDMDGVLCDFFGAAKKRIQEEPKIQFPQAEYGFFENLPPLEGAIESYKKLEELYDVRILTRASEFNIGCYSAKAFWVRKYLGFLAQRKMVFSSDKAIAIGEILVDDQTNANQEKFGEEIGDGVLMRFGSTDFPDWKITYAHLLDRHVKFHTCTSAEEWEALKGKREKLQKRHFKW